MTDTVTPEQEKPRVLIVDDSRLMRVAGKKILSENFEVQEASDGEEGWQGINADPALSVIISDLSMPKLNGLDLLDRIRESEDERIKTLPVIIVTGAEDEEKTRQEALARGATDFIIKPFDSVQLLARVKAQAQHNHTQRELKKTTSALEEQSNQDPFTELANLRYFQERGAKDLSLALRHGKPLSIALINIDDFDKLYLKHGKTAAGALLLELSKRLRTQVRKEDTAARTGLARFGLILPVTDAVGATKLAERIHACLTETEVNLGSTAIPVAVSIGLASPALEPGLNFETLLKTTEQNLAAAAAEGGNHIVGGVKHPPASPAVELSTALKMLTHGQTDELRPHLPSLLRRLLPLLELSDRELALGIEDAISKIRTYSEYR